MGATRMLDQKAVVTQPAPKTAASTPPAASDGSWTLRTRQWVDRVLPMDHLLPHRQPYYVGSWIYVFGVVTIAALVWVVVSGVVLSFLGPRGWQASSLGRSFNSRHSWSVQLFSLSMSFHLGAHSLLAGGADGGAATWMLG